MAAKFFMNGGSTSNWSDDTNWSTTASSGPNNTTHAVAADTVTVNAGSPAMTVDVPSACTSITFSGYTNTLAMTASLTTTGNVTLGSGMTLTGTADLILNGTATVTSNGKVWPGGIQLQGVNGTQFQFGTLSVTGTFTISTPGSTGAFITSSTVTVAGGLVCTGGSRENVGVSTFILTGGTWSGSGTFRNHLTLAGDVTISGTVTFSTYALSRSSGTITTTGSTVVIANAGATITCPGVTFNNLTFNGVTAVALGADLVVAGTLLINSSQVFTGAFTITCGSLVGFGGTFSGLVTVTGVMNLGANGQTATLDGGFTITAASAVITGTAIIVPNSPVVVTGTTTATWNFTLNGSSTWTTGGLDLSGAALGTGGNTGHGIVGTGTIIVTGGTLVTNAADAIEVNLQIAGNVTFVGTVLFATKTLSQTSGTISVGTSTLSLGTGATLTIAGVTWANVKFAGTSVTLGAALVVTGTLTLPNSALTISGAFNITCGTLTNVSITATRIMTFVHGTILTINTAFTIVHTAASTVRFTWKTDLAGSTMQFVLAGGATQSVKFVDPTDLDASAGQTIHTLSGVVVNSLNWADTGSVLSQLAVEVLVLSSIPVSAKASQVAVEVMLSSTTVFGRLSQLPVEVLVLPTSTLGANLSQVAVEVLVVPTPVIGGVVNLVWMGDIGSSVWIE